jgi:transcriptional regulator with XRE-family HTH domain
LSQEAFAEKAGLHRTYISAVERAKRSIALDNVQKIANALAAAMKWYYASPENTAEGNKIMAKAFNVPEAEFTQGLKDLKLFNNEQNVKMFGDAEKPGAFYDTMQRAADLYFNAKKINSKPDPKTIIDSSYLKNVKL